MSSQHGSKRSVQNEMSGGGQQSQFDLLRQRRFLPYFITQFLGAFNDNVFKNALIIMIAFQSSQLVDIDTDVLTNLSAGLFILPFFLFSATAGQWVERNEKSGLMRRVKMAEIIIMLAAAYGFATSDIYLLIGVLFLMGTQSTVFGPVKYSYLPQRLDEHELLPGNALVQMGTFVAILIGTMIGGILIAMPSGSDLVSIAIVAIALVGYLASRFVPETPANDPELPINPNPFSELWRNLGFIFEQRTIWIAVLGISWFWFLGASYLVQIPNYTRTILGGNEQVVTLLLTLFTLGVGTGALLCHKLSRGSIDVRLVVLGAIGLSLFGTDLYLSNPTSTLGELSGMRAFLQQSGTTRTMIDVLMLGISGGIYIVPLFTRLQHICDRSHMARVIAGNNIMNALMMVLSAGFAIFILGSEMNIADLFLIISAMNIIVAIFIMLGDPAYRWRRLTSNQI